MPTRLNPHHLLARQFPKIEHCYSARDTVLYALGLGLGIDVCDKRQLSYVYEGLAGDALQAFPTLVNVLAYPGFWVREPDAGIDWRRVVHAEQSVRWHAPIAASGCVTAQTRITGLWDRGEGRGAFLEQSRDIYDVADARLLASVQQLALLRGNGGFGAGGSASAVPAPHPMPVRSPDVVCDLATSAQMALIYRLSGDMNPLHADPDVAQIAGFDRPILHGMATMGVAAHAVLRGVLDYRSEHLKAMRVRFTAAVYPGDTLRSEIWCDANVLSLRMTALERNVIVLNHCRVDID